MAKDCSKIMRLIHDYRSEANKDRTKSILEYLAKKAISAGASQSVKYIAGAVAGAATSVVAGVLMPNMGIKTGSEQYAENLKEILSEMDRDSPNLSKLRISLSRLKGSYGQLLIEKDYGINSNCYDSLQKLIDELEMQINTMDRPGLA